MLLCLKTFWVLYFLLVPAWPRHLLFHFLHKYFEQRDKMRLHNSFEEPAPRIKPCMRALVSEAFSHSASCWLTQHLCDILLLQSFPSCFYHLAPSWPILFLAPSFKKNIMDDTVSPSNHFLACMIQDHRDWYSFLTRFFFIAFKQNSSDWKHYISLASFSSCHQQGLILCLNPLHFHCFQTDFPWLAPYLTTLDFLVFSAWTF